MLVTKRNGVAGGRAAEAGARGGVPAAEPVAGELRGHLRLGRAGDLAVLRVHRGLDHDPGVLVGGGLELAADRAVRGVAVRQLQQPAGRGGRRGRRGDPGHGDRLYRDQADGVDPVGADRGGVHRGGDPGDLVPGRGVQPQPVLATVIIAATSPWNIIHIAVFPLAAAGFLAYIIVRSVEGLGGWAGRDLVSLYVLVGIGVPISIYVRFRGGSDYFKLPRETYQPGP